MAEQAEFDYGVVRGEGGDGGRGGGGTSERMTQDGSGSPAPVVVGGG